ncbi:GDSL esterase/lipase At2g27360-like isoform X2 [Curcuma longa]|uniref:GDSL esterase/lipase At2g27360-like isoform X2 n=1 Tax=Curcuma longa TaxID=136217 RepID=UPI003D9DF984
MASYPFFFFFFFFFFFLLQSPRSLSCYSAIFSFGDSLTDTGNIVYFSGGADPANRVPYGETYFRRPVGRYSDGRIVLDFLAQTLGLPLVPPYDAGHNREAPDFASGANFAVAGASALSPRYYEAKGLNVSGEDYSLVTQLKWFRQMLQFSHIGDTFDDALFFVGEIGVNDYKNLLSMDGKSVDYARCFAPSIVQGIGSAIDELLQTGARAVMVAGMFPLGCIPLFLTMFLTQQSDAYEPETGCLKSLNLLSQYHNLLLQHELGQIQKAHPRSKIIYADLYDNLMSVYKSPEQFGIKSTVVACCGGEGPYNFSFSVMCGDPTSKWCSRPLNYMCWDGMHFTEAASRVIARNIIEGSSAHFSNSTKMLADT